MKYFRAKANFDIKAGDWFVINTFTNEVILEVQPKGDVKMEFEAMASNSVSHPAHYNTGNIEVIEAIEDWKLPYHRGNVVKYVARAGKKNPAKEVEDLQKAAWYLLREIELLECAGQSRTPKRPNEMVKNNV